MAKWKKIVTEGETAGTITQNTLGSATGLVTGTVLDVGQGGTGANLSEESFGLLYKDADGALATTNTPSTGEVLGNNAGVPTWVNPNLSHTHDQYIDQTGDVDIAGNLSVNGTFSATSVSVTSWDLGDSSSQYFLLNNSGAFGTGNHYGIKVHDDNGTDGDASDDKYHNIVYDVDDSDATKGRWKIGSATTAGGSDNLMPISTVHSVAANTMSDSYASGDPGDIALEGSGDTGVLWICTEA